MRWPERTVEYLSTLVERYGLTPDRVERTRSLSERSALIRGAESVIEDDVAVGYAIECDEWLNRRAHERDCQRRR